MATIKAYTTIEQGLKLAEILPLESADMSYRAYKEEGGISDYQADLCPHRFASWIGIPCWSLAALLEEIPYEICDDDGNSAYLSMYKENDNYQLVYESASDDFDDIETDVYEDFIDACYEMILKLNDNNLL